MRRFCLSSVEATLAGPAQEHPHCEDDAGFARLGHDKLDAEHNLKLTEIDVRPLPKSLLAANQIAGAATARTTGNACKG